MIFQIASVAFLLCGYAFGICLGVPRTFRAYQKWRETLQEKYFGHFISDLGLSLFMFLAPSIVFIKKIYFFLN